MNPRIRELAQQAEQSVKWGDPNNYDNYHRAMDEWQEKFAELIMRETFDWVVDNVGLMEETEWNALKKHFGVEGE